MPACTAGQVASNAAACLHVSRALPFREPDSLTPIIDDIHEKFMIQLRGAYPCQKMACF